MKKSVLIGLLINVLIPGLGSVASDKVKVGVVQLLLTAVGGVFIYLDLPNLLAGIVLVSAWLWALMTSIELLQRGR